MSTGGLLLLVLIEVLWSPSQWSPVAGFSSEEGTPCKVGTSAGTCLLAPKCPPAVKAVQMTNHHNLPRCGFSGLEEIVCCPDDDKDKAEVRGPIISKSFQVCEQFADVVGARVGYHILEGEDAKVGEFPHMAAIGYEDEDSDDVDWGCGGSLISERYVLTAAHCVSKRGRIPVQIRLGKIDINGTSDKVAPQDYVVKNITVHPKYSRTSKQNDIALIEVTQRVTFDNYVLPACLYHKSDDPSNLLISGWGFTSADGNTTTILQKASIEPVPVEECNATHLAIPLSKSISHTQICAKSKKGKQDTCQGDSGGPLQIQIMKGSSIYSIVGVTSFGRGCGGTTPGIYTRVYSYIKWIESVVWPE